MVDIFKLVTPQWVQTDRQQWEAHNKIEEVRKDHCSPEVFPQFITTNIQPHLSSQLEVMLRLTLLFHILQMTLSDVTYESPVDISVTDSFTDPSHKSRYPLYTFPIPYMNTAPYYGIGTGCRYCNPYGTGYGMPGLGGLGALGSMGYGGMYGAGLPGGLGGMYGYNPMLGNGMLGMPGLGTGLGAGITPGLGIGTGLGLGSAGLGLGPGLGLGTGLGGTYGLYGTDLATRALLGNYSKLFSFTFENN